MSEDLYALLREWKALEAAATPGPWFADGSCLMHDVRHADLDHDFRVSLLNGTDGVDVPGWCESAADAEFIAASRTIIPRLIAAVEAVLKVHRPSGVYDKCECVDPDPDDGVHIEVEEVGITCNCIYEVCRECCAGDEYLTESCMDYHEHNPGDKHLCSTVAALHTALIRKDVR